MLEMIFYFYLSPFGRLFSLSYQFDLSLLTLLLWNIQSLVWWWFLWIWFILLLLFICLTLAFRSRLALDLFSFCFILITLGVVYFSIYSFLSMLILFKVSKNHTLVAENPIFTFWFSSLIVHQIFPSAFLYVWCAVLFLLEGGKLGYGFQILHFECRYL